MPTAGSFSLRRKIQEVLLDVWLRMGRGWWTHVDVYAPDEDVVAVTFSNDSRYVEAVGEIELRADSKAEELVRFSAREVHRRLLQQWYRGDGTTAEGGTHRQALFCPYYVKLSGSLGYDWGLMVNPDSRRFGELVFEHDDCGCAEGFHEHSEEWQRQRDPWRAES